MKIWLYKLSQNQKRIIVFIHDTFMAALAFPAAVALRFGHVGYLEYEINDFWILCAIAFFVKISVFFYFKLSRGIWKFSSTPDLMLILKSVTTAMFLCLLVMFLYNRLELIPRSVFIIDWFVLVFMLGGSRLSYRIYIEGRDYGVIKKNTLIVGAGTGGEQLLREIKRDTHSDIKVVGFIDDNLKRHKRTIHGVPVVGSVRDISTLKEKFNIENIFIAIPSATASEIRRIAEICMQNNLPVKTLPSIKDLVDGKVELAKLRPVNVEDLLGRKPVRLDTKALGDMLENRVILITGAGGSIGSELCLQIAKFKPKVLILLDSFEYSMYKHELDLVEKFPHLSIIPCIADIRDEKRIDNIMKKYKPEIVFHAAAYKHVPMMEMNAGEAIKTNVLGTKILAECAVRNNITKFVMISTDKAVNPTNIMGATKRIAEMICQSLELVSSTHFEIVRFGNVLGSSGSVIPRFMKQIEAGGPVKVTHPEIIRYFMSIPEATQLVLQAGCLGKGGEIFVLDMGKPVKIIDLAKDLIKLTGHNEEEIKIEFTGLRPGEKLYEELLADEETTLPTSHEMVRVAKVRPAEENFLKLINQLFEDPNEESNKIITKIKQLVPEYNPYQATSPTTRIEQ